MIRVHILLLPSVYITKNTPRMSLQVLTFHSHRPTKNSPPASLSLPRLYRKASASESSREHFIFENLSDFLAFHEAAEFTSFTETFFDGNGYPLLQRNMWLRLRSYPNGRHEWTLKFNVCISQNVLLIKFRFDAREMISSIAC